MATASRLKTPELGPCSTETNLESIKSSLEFTALRSLLPLEWRACMGVLISQERITRSIIVNAQNVPRRIRKPDKPLYADLAAISKTTVATEADTLSVKHFTNLWNRANAYYGKELLNGASDEVRASNIQTASYQEHLSVHFMLLTSTGAFKGVSHRFSTDSFK